MGNIDGHMGLWSVVPILLAIVCAVVTRKVILALFLGLFVALLILEGGNPATATTSLHAYVDRFLERLREGQARQQAQIAAAEKNAAFLVTLESLQLREDTSTRRSALEPVRASFAEAFADFGIDLEVLTDREAAGIMVASGLAVEIAQALDEWARVETSLGGSTPPCGNA